MNRILAESKADCAKAVSDMTPFVAANGNVLREFLTRVGAQDKAAMEELMKATAALEPYVQGSADTQLKCNAEPAFAELYKQVTPAVDAPPAEPAADGNP
jgi:hypothetical protein